MGCPIEGLPRLVTVWGIRSLGEATGPGYKVGVFLLKQDYRKLKMNRRSWLCLNMEIFPVFFPESGEIAETG